MILLQSHSRYLLQILTNRLQNIEKGVELDCHWVEFDDVRYHIQASIKSPNLLHLSVSLPTPPPETDFSSGLPLGAIEAIKAAYAGVVHILDPPRDGFNLTVKLNLAKLPPLEGLELILVVDLTVRIQYSIHGFTSFDFILFWNHPISAFASMIFQLSWIIPEYRESLACLAESTELNKFLGSQLFPTHPNLTFFWKLLSSSDNMTLSLLDGAEIRHALVVKIASVREVVMGAPLRVILKRVASRSVPSNAGVLVPLVHRPNESFFLVPQVEKATVVFPMRFNDSVDTVLATSFLQEFVEARRTAGLNNAPTCLWSASPPDELKDAPEQALHANAGFVSFVIYPRHVEGKKLDKTVWSLSTFHAYVNYHVKCSEGFMHTRMRRRVESLIQALDRAKPDEHANISKSYKRLSIEESRGNSHS
ncbi:ARP2/3 complex, 34kDa subunit (p34-Arc) [Cynara cardunculus var. scolymus]|uniref:ARP2/3 complex, 34kDa subunit (p34-Arc) n=1 Tax=Cynara cardunculus var. scolymus TaxID=59895 RepID=A0A124SAG9_CYNCS|nr:ARP2/3 complex, 34kDa subunit (p34-Arc) [Cynara cardunculus var. scolymus]